MLQKIIKMLFFSLMVLSCASLIIGCAESAKTPVAASEMSENLRAEIINADQKITKAYENQWDVLAYSEIRSSAEHVEKAKKYFQEGGNLERITKELRDADSEHKAAKLIAEARAPRVEGLLIARKKVIEAGARREQIDSNSLYRLDKRFRDLADDNKINLKSFSKLQNDYLNLSGMVVKNINVSKAKQQINFALNNKARRYAPRTLHKAELDLKSAENMIEVHMTDPMSYEAAVKKANLSAEMLVAVVVEQRKVNFNLDEMAAQKIVQQNQKMNQLNADLSKKSEDLYYTQTELTAYQQELDNTRREISKKDQELNLAKAEALKNETKLTKAQNEKRFQTALALAQKQFSKSEADVYRQGDKLLIRLKKIEFPIGKAEVPIASKPLLNKVAEVAKQLGPEQLIIEGHTDATGSAEQNNIISQERADSVKEYLENTGIPKSILQSEGYGFEKPLSSNKTRKGRAQNRRVDIWITPAPEIKAIE